MAIRIPVGFLDQALEALVMLVGDKVARPLPALHIARWVGIRRAGQVPLARKEIEVNGRAHHPVRGKQLLRGRKLLMDIIPRHVDFLGRIWVGVMDCRVAIGRADHESVHAE